MISTFIVYFLWLLVGVEGVLTAHALAYSVVNKVRCNPFNLRFWLAAITAIILLIL